MHYLISLYKGANRVFTQFLNLKYEERKKQLMFNIDDVSSKYFEMIMDCINSNFDEIEDYDKIEESERRNTELVINIDEQIDQRKKANQTLFCILIEFLLECGCDDILFNEYMPKTLEILKDNNRFFMECLGPFFFAKKVKFIPEDKLNEILNYQLRNKDYEQLQRMIASLDHTRIDTTQLIKVSLKQGLLLSLTIICSQGDAEEYLTPLVKLWSYILVLIDKQEFDQASYFMVRALTFIKMTMQRKTITGERIDNQKLLVYSVPN